MEESLRTIKDKVAFILETYPSTRDSDKYLWLSYLTNFHGLKSVLGNNGDAYADFIQLILDKDTPTMESIRRVRQKLQEKGLYVGENRSERIEESRKVRAWANEGIQS